MKQNLKRLREDQGLTQEQLAEKLKINRMTINHIESGKANPTKWIIDRILNFFRVKYEDLW